MAEYVLWSFGAVENIKVPNYRRFIDHFNNSFVRM